MSSASPVEVFSTLGCPYCVRAKKTLAQLGVPYVEHDVTDDEAQRAEVARRAMRTSVPQIFIDGAHLGGCDDLLAAVENGKLAKMLEPFGIALRVVRDKAESDLSASDGAVPSQLLPRDGILNHLEPPDGAGAHSAGEIASSLQRQMLGLYDEFVTADGSRVDYARMRCSPRFLEYAHAASKLRAVLHSSLPSTRAAQLAFWLNLYNALVIHGMAVVGAPADRTERGAFYGGESGVAYDLGGTRLSLDDIEHGIVRGSPVGDERSFAAGDKRAALVLPRATFDARIHFALNCGAKSCPPIKIYSGDPDQLEHALSLAAQSFCESTTTVQLRERTVRLSKLFDWYAVDFGSDDRVVLEQVSDFFGESSSSTCRELRELLAYGGERAIDVQYDGYDWGANDADA